MLFVSLETEVDRTRFQLKTLSEELFDIKEHQRIEENIKSYDRPSAKMSFVNY